MNKIFKTAISAIAFAALVWSCSEQPNEKEFTGDFGNENAQYRNTETKNLSPYAIFGDSSFVLMTEEEWAGKHSLTINNFNDSIEYSRFELELKTGLVKIFDKNGAINEEFILPPDAIARFLSVDPRAEKYYAWSPYNYVLGNPILNIDPRGDTVKISHKGNDYVYNNGTLTLNGQEYTGKVRGFLKRAVNGLNQISATEAGGAMINSLVASEHNIVLKYRSGAANFVPGFERFGSPDLRNNAEGLRVQETGKKVIEFFDFTEVGSGGTVYWDPSARPNGEKSNIVLAHELFHGLDATNGMLDSRYINVNGGMEQIQEVRAVHNTNLIRREFGYKLRRNYSSNGPSLLDANGNPINVSPPYGF